MRVSSTSTSALTMIRRLRDHHSRNAHASGSTGCQHHLPGKHCSRARYDATRSGADGAGQHHPAPPPHRRRHHGRRGRHRNRSLTRRGKRAGGDGRPARALRSARTPRVRGRPPWHELRLEQRRYRRRVWRLGHSIHDLVQAVIKLNGRLDPPSIFFLKKNNDLSTLWELRPIKIIPIVNFKRFTHNHCTYFAHIQRQLSWLPKVPTVIIRNVFSVVIMAQGKHNVT